MILKTVFTHHKHVIVGSRIASKVIMVTPNKPNFLISKISKFSLERNCLTHILPLLLSFLNFLQCTDVKNLKTHESLFLFSIMPHFSIFLSLLSGLLCTMEIFPDPQPSTTSHPSFSPSSYQPHQLSSF